MAKEYYYSRISPFYNYGVAFGTVLLSGLVIKQKHKIHGIGYRAQRAKIESIVICYAQINRSRIEIIRKSTADYYEAETTMLETRRAKTVGAILDRYERKIRNQEIAEAMSQLSF